MGKRGGPLWGTARGTRGSLRSFARSGSNSLPQLFALFRELKGHDVDFCGSPPLLSHTGEAEPAVVIRQSRESRCVGKCFGRRIDPCETPACGEWNRPRRFPQNNQGAHDFSHALLGKHMSIWLACLPGPGGGGQEKHQQLCWRRQKAPRDGVRRS